MSNDPLRKIMEEAAQTDGVNYTPDQLMAWLKIASLVTEEGLTLEQVAEYADSLSKGAKDKDAMAFAKVVKTTGHSSFGTNIKPN